MKNRVPCGNACTTPTGCYLVGCVKGKPRSADAPEAHNLVERIAAELRKEEPITIRRTRRDGKMRGNEKLLSFYADVIVELKADGTYKIVKDKNINFEPRDETVYGLKDARALNLPKFTIMTGHMSGGVFMGKEV